MVEGGDSSSFHRSQLHSDCQKVQGGWNILDVGSAVASKKEKMGVGKNCENLYAFELLSERKRIQ